MTTSKPYIVTDRLEAVLRTIGELTRGEVLVGIPAGPPRPNDPTKPATGKQEPTNAVIGYAMEFGLPDQNVPARPFLVPALSQAREALADELESGAKRTLSAIGLAGAVAEAGSALERVGLLAASKVQRYLTTTAYTPLAPATLAARRRRGRTGTKPLIDTGELRRSITYVVRGR